MMGSPSSEGDTEANQITSFIMIKSVECCGGREHRFLRGGDGNLISSQGRSGKAHLRMVWVE